MRKKEEAKRPRATCSWEKEWNGVEPGREKEKWIWFDLKLAETLVNTRIHNERIWAVRRSIQFYIQFKWERAEPLLHLKYIKTPIDPIRSRIRSVCIHFKWSMPSYSIYTRARQVDSSLYGVCVCVCVCVCAHIYLMSIPYGRMGGVCMHPVACKAWGKWGSCLVWRAERGGKIASGASKKIF